MRALCAIGAYQPPHIHTLIDQCVLFCQLIDQLTGCVLFLSHRCRRAQPQTSDGPSLYVGGVDLFALPSNATQYMDFVGSIRNVIIGSTQLDLGCPSQEENAILGFHRSSSCENVSLSCIGAHTTGCVDYAPQPYCSCLGGFDPQACQQENSESSFLSSSPLSSSFLLPPPFLLPPLLSLPSPSLCLSPCASVTYLLFGYSVYVLLTSL